jgi:hypothetical protein
MLTSKQALPENKHCLFTGLLLLMPVCPVDPLLPADIRRVTLGLVAAAGRLLQPGGILSIYGPFKINNEFTTDSNHQFHETLVATNPEWGYRDVGDITTAASAAGLQQQQCVAMPANNYLLVYKRV